jgi:endonuclease/exonuclease/phosphatase family metal-dependent hydrolase
MQLPALRVLLCCVLGLASSAQETTSREAAPVEFRALTWNIWRGGREDGEELGPARVVDVLRASGADAIALQETYGSGERIAKELGFHFLPRGDNVSIVSRFAILEDLSVHEPFGCVGALLELPNGSKLAFFSIWLPYSAEVWEQGQRERGDAAALLAACRASTPELEKIRAGLEQRLSDAKYAGVPVIVAGDFNSMSRLDYTELAKSQFHAVVDFPTSRVLLDAGFRDAYRETNKVVDRLADRTWTPRFPEQEQDRIDFVYYRGLGLAAQRSWTIERHAERFPSDHAAVAAQFRFDPRATAPTEVALRVASYNIRHGAGLDGKLKLERTEEALRKLDADLIGLQEVDVEAARTGGVHQAAELGRRLDMHAAFGSFMDFEGGRYGLALLSRYPLRSTTSLRLPDGNEPRVALLAEVELPGGEAVHVVNVHFDWVGDDGFRFAQASKVAEHLRQLGRPYVLLGDFNDGPASRTLALFRAAAIEAVKPEGASFTFPANQPAKEIDYIFFAPAERWAPSGATVVDERLASDHRPVIATLKYRCGARAFSPR